MSKSYDQQGFPITATPSPAATTLGQAPCFGANCGSNGKVVETGTSSAGGARQTFGALLGVVGAVLLF
jgi:hypothetical protein